MRAVILLSGGLDSTTMLAMAALERRDIYALSFGYSQRHARELGCACRQAVRYAAKSHEIVDLTHMGRLVGSATSLIDGAETSTSQIPATYVPARNTVFLAYALAWAEAIGAGEIWLGINAVDYSGYPDCRPAYARAFQNLADLATREGVEGRAISLCTPLLAMSKAEIVRTGWALQVDYSDTLSCYTPQGAHACGSCDSCRLRLLGFEQAGLCDPALYTG